MCDSVSEIGLDTLKGQRPALDEDEDEEAGSQRLCKECRWHGFKQGQVEQQVEQ